MGWVVDTAVLIDVLEHDPEFDAISARALDARGRDGLVLCPISYVELAPAFEGNIAFEEEFLEGVGVGRPKTPGARTLHGAHTFRSAVRDALRRDLLPIS